MNGRDLISKKTRTEFREFLVRSTSREIEKEFSAAGLEPDRSFAPQIGGARRDFVEQYYHAINFADPAQVEKVLRVFEAILANTESHLANPGACVDSAALKREFDKLAGCLRHDGYEYADGRLRSRSDHTMLRHLSTTAVRLDAEYLAAQIDRLTEAVEQDPDLAIGQAKELIETCCKTILAAAGETDADRLDLVPLVKWTMARLKLLPDNIPETAKGAKTIKAVLGNLAMISQGMAELRNLYGTGHGRHASHKRLPVRHARLAVGAATALVMFLFDTHESRPKASKQGGASVS